MVICCSRRVAFVSRRHAQDTIGVDIEAHLDLEHAARRWRDAAQPESPQALVLAGQGPLPLQHVDLHRGLVIFRGGEGLGPGGGDGGIAGDQDRHHAALRLDAQGEQGHVQQQQVAGVALQHGHHRVGRAQIDAQLRGHGPHPSVSALRLLLIQLAEQFGRRGCDIRVPVLPGP
jgi:hypothetical protein